jgi:hypothetical protein
MRFGSLLNQKMFYLHRTNYNGFDKHKKDLNKRLENMNFT